MRSLSHDVYMCVGMRVGMLAR